jgi:hypothetical protein
VGGHSCLHQNKHGMQFSRDKFPHHTREYYWLCLVENQEKLLFKSGCKACLVARTGRADPNVAREGAKIGEVGFAQHKVQILKKLALVP